MAMLHVQANAWDRSYVVRASHSLDAPVVLRFSLMEMEPGESPENTAYRLLRERERAAREKFEREQEHERETQRQAQEQERTAAFLARDDSSHLAWI